LLRLLLERGDFSGFAFWSQKLLSGDGGFCPVCAATNVRWLPLPDHYRQQSERYGFKHLASGEMTALDTYLCPACNASDRERLYALFLGLETTCGTMPDAPSMIHFAPEPALSSHIRQQRHFASCETADMDMPEVDFHVDLQNLPFQDNAYDFFICSHVLEHVADDRKAIRELYRITKPGGGGLLMAPICRAIDRTMEDPAITSESERWRLFGQGDHVRLYSHDDYVARIEEAGFSLRQLTRDDFSEEIFRRLGLKSTSILYVVIKPVGAMGETHPLPGIFRLRPTLR
jgi:SAM-dependent methyltransferase